MKWHEWQKRHAPRTLAGDCSCNEALQADEEYQTEMRWMHEARTGRNLAGCLLIGALSFWGVIALIWMICRS